LRSGAATIRGPVAGGCARAGWESARGAPDMGAIKLDENASPPGTNAAAVATAAMTVPRDETTMVPARAIE